MSVKLGFVFGGAGDACSCNCCCATLSHRTFANALVAFKTGCAVVVGGAGLNFANTLVALETGCAVAVIRARRAARHVAFVDTDLWRLAAFNDLETLAYDAFFDTVTSATHCVDFTPIDHATALSAVICVGATGVVFALVACAAFNVA